MADEQMDLLNPELPSKIHQKVRKENAAKHNPRGSLKIEEDAEEEPSKNAKEEELGNEFTFYFISFINYIWRWMVDGG